MDVEELYKEFDSLEELKKKREKEKKEAEFFWKLLNLNRELDKIPEDTIEFLNKYNEIQRIKKENFRESLEE